MSGAQLVGAKCMDSSFIGTRFDRANLAAAVLSGRFDGARVNGAGVNETALAPASLSGIFAGANLTRLDLRGTYLAGSDFGPREDTYTKIGKSYVLDPAKGNPTKYREHF